MVGHQGLEHHAETPAKPKDSGKGGAESGAVAADSDPAGPASAPSELPPDVRELARRLAALPETVRAGIVAMIRSFENGGQGVPHNPGTEAGAE